MKKYTKVYYPLYSWYYNKRNKYKEGIITSLVLTGSLNLDEVIEVKATKLFDS